MAKGARRNLDLVPKMMGRYPAGESLDPLATSESGWVSFPYCSQHAWVLTACHLAVAAGSLLAGNGGFYFADLRTN
jgi:hypothetical protein